MKAAVNGHNLTGDVGGGVRQQERDHAGHVVRLSEPPEGNAAGHRFPRLRRHGRGHVRLDEAGGHGIDGDRTRGHLPGHRLREADEARLARGVVGLARVAGEPHDRRHVHDAAVALLDHGPQRGPRAEEGAGQVGRQDRVPLLRLHPEHQVVARHPGVVHEMVEPALGLDDRLDRRLRRGAIADVEEQGRRLAAGGGDLLDHLAQPCLVPRAEVDGRSLARQPAGDRPADAARGAADQRDSAGQRAGGRHAVLAAGDSAARVFSREAGSSTCWCFAPFAMRRPSPVSTVPGPTSTNIATPSATSFSTISCQRTEADTWRTRPSRHSSAVRTTRASTLLTRGASAARKEMRARSAASRSWAGAMIAEWKGADTGKRTAFRAPAAVQASAARSTAAASPAITIWPGPFMLAGLTTWPWAASRQAFSTVGRPRPMMAAIAPWPAGTASCMYCPRRRTATTASFRSIAPAATRAEYSPRLWPATHSARAPRACSARKAATLVARIAGCVLAVSCSSASGPSKQ